ncbi:hypothetical protein ACXIUS_14350 [Bosea thiooxidans]
MERSLRSFASSLALLSCAALSAAAQEAPPPASPGDSPCETGTVEKLMFAMAQRSHCRALWQSRIEEMRRRNKAHVARVAEESRQRRELEASLPPPPPPQVTVESFLRDGGLGHGDAVVTDKGPRVFIGKDDGTPTSADFVALDSPLSPHRGNTTPYDGAFPNERRLQPPKHGKATRKPQERQP